MVLQFIFHIVITVLRCYIQLALLSEHTIASYFQTLYWY